MNRRQAIEAMLAGQTVRAVEPLYHNHRRSPWYRWNEGAQYFEWCQFPPNWDWKRSNGSLYLASQFELVEPVHHLELPQ